MRNVIMVHLEAMPQTQFWQYQAELRTLWRLKEQSLYFTRCHAAGTATVFAYNSIFRGSVAGLDHLETYSYDESHRMRAGDSSVVADLRERYGCQTAFMLFNTHIPTGPLPQEAAGYGFDAHLTGSPYDRQSPVVRTWLESLDRKRPFFIYMHYLVDLLHHRIPLPVLQSHIADDAGDMSALVMRMLDESVADTLACVGDKGLLDDAVTFVFGDHGWDYSGRFNSDAFEQGADVSSSAAWVPLFVHNSYLGKGVNDSLVSLDDFPLILGDVATDGEYVYQPGGLFPGVNPLRQKRDCAFTQNKYALQSTTVRGNETPKSYAVTDGMFRLIVENGDPEKRRGGMSFYLEQLDPGNQADLLDLFALGPEGDVVGLNHDVLQSGKLMAYPPFLGISGLSALFDRYSSLRERLRGYVREKEKQALTKKKSVPHVLTEESFRFAKKGWERESGASFADITARLKKLAASEQPVLLFGTRTFITFYVLAVLRYYGVKIAGFMDNMACEQHGRIDDLLVYPPNEAARLFPRGIVVSCVSGAVPNAEVAGQCRSLGFEYVSYVEDLVGSKLW